MASGRQSAPHKEGPLLPPPGGQEKMPETAVWFTASPQAILPSPTQRPRSQKSCMVWERFVRCLEFQITSSRALGPLTPEARGRGAPGSGDPKALSTDVS